MVGRYASSQACLDHVNHGHGNCINVCNWPYWKRRTVLLKTILSTRKPPKCSQRSTEKLQQLQTCYTQYMGLIINKGRYGMFVACGIWCLTDVSSVSNSSEQTEGLLSTISHRRQTYHINLCSSNPYSAYSPKQSKTGFFSRVVLVLGCKKHMAFAAPYGCVRFWNCCRWKTEQNRTSRTRAYKEVFFSNFQGLCILKKCHVSYYCSESH